MDKPMAEKTQTADKPLAEKPLRPLWSPFTYFPHQETGIRWMLDKAQVPPNIPDANGHNALDYVCSVCTRDKSSTFVDLCILLADILIWAGCEPRLLQQVALKMHARLADHIKTHLTTEVRGFTAAKNACFKCMHTSFSL